MWKNLSLRVRLFLPLGVLFAIALLIGASALEVFSPTQFVYENQPEGDAVRVVAQALNDALKSSSDPRRTLEAFTASLQATSAVIKYRPAEHGDGPPPVRTASSGVPQWFVGLLKIPELGAAYPVAVDAASCGTVNRDRLEKPDDDRRRGRSRSRAWETYRMIDPTAGEDVRREMQRFIADLARKSDLSSKALAVEALKHVRRLGNEARPPEPRRIT